VLLATIVNVLYLPIQTTVTSTDVTEQRLKISSVFACSLQMLIHVNGSWVSVVLFHEACQWLHIRFEVLTANVDRMSVLWYGNVAAPLNQYIREALFTQITSWSPTSLAAMHGSASRSNVGYYPALPQRRKWTRLLQCLNCPMFAVRLWINTSLYRWPTGSLS
jgi:hypothetical protein